MGVGGRIKKAQKHFYYYIKIIYTSKFFKLNDMKTLNLKWTQDFNIELLVIKQH